MAHRRKPQVATASTFTEEIGSPYCRLAPPSLAAKAIRASSAYDDMSLSSAYSPHSNPLQSSPSPSSAKNGSTYQHTSMKNLNEPKQGFWEVLAQKAKAILDDDDDLGQPSETSGGSRVGNSDKAARYQLQNTDHSPENPRKTDRPSLQKRLGAIASSLNYIGGTVGSAIEEGLTVVENRAADFIQETRKLQRRKESSSFPARKQDPNFGSVRQQPVMQTQIQPQTQTDLEMQLKASRDVAMAMAAKAKLLLRELKTVKADLGFAKARCGQLDKENSILREGHEKGNNLNDDDLIRLQLETLLAEKARLAQENSVLARENRFLREIVEYRQLTMQDVVYLNERTEEITEVYPIKAPGASNL